MPKVISPHDRFFRSAMQNQQVAIDFVNHYLPKKIRHALNTTTLRCTSSHYIDKELSETISDLVLECELAEQPAYISLLIEHQSSPDKMLPLRVHHYLFNLLHRYYKEHPKEPLPAVYALAFYHGEATPYPYSLDLFDCFNDPLTLMPQVIGQPLPLIDVNQLSDEQLAQQQWIGPMLESLKYIRQADMTPYTINILDHIRWPLAESAAKELLRSLLYYLLNAGNIANINDILHSTDRISQPVRGEIMSLAEKLRAEGHEAGREEGREAERQAMAKAMLAEEADPAFVVKVTGLTMEQVESLTIKT